jgi:hypothetical protein
MIGKKRHTSEAIAKAAAKIVSLQRLNMSSKL